MTGEFDCGTVPHAKLFYIWPAVPFAQLADNLPHRNPWPHIRRNFATEPENVQGPRHDESTVTFSELCNESRALNQFVKGHGRFGDKS